MTKNQLIFGAIVSLVLFYRLYKIIRYVLFAGFAPFKASHRWAIELMLTDIIQARFADKNHLKIVSINAGPAGFLGEMYQLFPGATLTAVVTRKLHYWRNWVQTMLHCRKIKLIQNSDIYSIEIKNADIVYCRLDPDELLLMTKKFKYELKSGALLISSKSPVPNMVEEKIYNIPPVIKQPLFGKKKTPEEIKKLSTILAEMHYLYKI